MDPLKELQQQAEADLARQEQSLVGERTSESLRTHGYLAHTLESFLIEYREKIDAVVNAFPFLMTHHLDEFEDVLHQSNDFTGYVETDSLVLQCGDGLRDTSAELVLFTASRDHWDGTVESGRWHGNYRHTDPVTTIAAIGMSKGFHLSILHDFMTPTKGNKLEGTEVHHHLIDELVTLTQQGVIDLHSDDHYPEVKSLTEDEIVTTIKSNLQIAYDACLRVMKKNYQQ